MKSRKSTVLGVVIPCYNVADHIYGVVHSIPDDIDHIVLVNDRSIDNTSQVIKELISNDKRVICCEHSHNQGVGGAMITGFKLALDLGCEYIFKLDGDGQMDPKYLPKLLEPLVSGKYQFSKGNRFNDFKALKKMPFPRRFGNLFLSFMIKAASGYWSVFDPTNGFFCIKRETLERLSLARIEKRYFFESSLLIELFYTGARIYDVPIPAIYGEEKSNLSEAHSLWTFPFKILKATIRRIILRYFIYDFNIFSIYLVIGAPLLIFGILFGLIKWIQFGSADVPAPTGTVMIATLSVILGVQLLLSVIQYDITSKNPFSANSAETE